MEGANYAGLAVFRPIPSRFEYAVPADLRGEVEVGAVCAVPFRGERERGVVVELRDEPSFSGERERIREVLSEKPLEEPLLELARWLSWSSFTPLGQVFKRMVPADLSVRPRSKKSVELSGSFGKVRRFIEEESRRAPKQAEILEQLLTADGPIEKKSLLVRADSSRSPLKSLVGKGFVEEVDLPETGDDGLEVPAEFDLPDPLSFSTEELAGIAGSFERYSFTAPGKERLAGYLGAVHSLAEEGSVLMLAPDVLRSRELAGMIEKELGLSSLTYHSELTDGERAQRWKLSRSGKVDVFVGVLSAIYLPFSNLRGIIVEDEGSRNYELKEQDPKGNLAVTASKRAELEDVPVVLGGRAPSINSYHRLRKGELSHLGSDTRTFPPDSDQLEFGSPVSTSTDGSLDGGLRSLLEENYRKERPALIIGERAGPSGAGICQDCGAVLRCPDCGVPLAYGSSGNSGICPYCGEREGLISCRDCGSDEVKFIGGGLEEVERELNSLLPEAEVLSYDSGVASRSRFSRAVDGLMGGDIDILLGTPVVGSLFLREEVPLVGLLDLDISLNRTTYRSTEFLLRRILLGQELVEPGGRVFLQGVHGDREPLGPVGRGNWKRLYERELESRRLMGYPPYRELVEIEVRGSETSEARERIAEVKRELGERVPEAETLGPTEKDLVGDSNHGPRSYLMVKTEELADLLDALNSILPRSERRKVRLNPYS